ncbi:MAG: DinB family protein [Flavobacteriales bacterium]|nr:DinB family protein [Flavobacteriales bacterium]
MDIVHLLREYAAYDQWANGRLLERLEREDPALLDAPVKSSFPTLRDTLLHVRDAEHVWLCRLQGLQHNWPAEADRSLATLLKHGALLQTYVMGLDQAELERERTYHDLKGNAHHQAAWRMLMHCFNHSSYHRGQVVTIMRGLGLEGIPAMDLVVYQRTLARS